MTRENIGERQQQDEQFSGIYVTEAAMLTRLCAEIKHAEYIAVDTEFSRTRSYYPQMSLIQVAAPKVAFAADLLSIPADKLSPLVEILRDPNCCKVFHSGRQDLEGINYALSTAVYNIFDTQVALQFCGFKEQPGYEAMVRHYLQIKVAKDMQFSNWMARPLSQEQLDYAIADVVHLLDIYPMILAEIKAANKLAWVQQECRDIAEIAVRPPSNFDILRKLELNTNDEVVLARAYRLVEWRERQAIRLNLTRFFVMPDVMLAALARKPELFPQSNNQYNKLGSRNKVPGASLKELVANPPDLQSPITEEERSIASTVVSENKKLSKNELFRSLRTMLTEVATEHTISEQLIASQQDILRLANRQKSKLDSGWRHEIFGKAAAALRDAAV